MMRLNNRRLIINNDFDGLVSTKILLEMYEGNKVVGFSNSKDRLFLVDGEEFKGDELFVDMFTPYHDSVDQHIHPYACDRNLNPNTERGLFTFGDNNTYNWKYPSSTCVWLATLAAADKKDVERYFNGRSNYMDGGRYNLRDVVFRADDTLMNAVKYNENMKNNWAPWLVKRSGKNETIESFFDFITEQTEDKVQKWKSDMDNHYCQFKFSKEELPDIEEPRAKEFMQFFGINFDKVTSVVKLEHKTTSIHTKEEFDRLYEKYGNNLFSFAFRYSPKRADIDNFSYSLINTQ